MATRFSRKTTTTPRGRRPWPFSMRGSSRSAFRSTSDSQPRRRPGLESMKDSPPFRAEHVGSLLRTKELLQAREDYAHQRITAEERRCIEDRAVQQVVKMQEDVGLQGVTDGELRRGSWHMDFLYQIGGVSTGQA